MAVVVEEHHVAWNDNHTSFVFEKMCLDLQAYLHVQWPQKCNSKHAPRCRAEQKELQTRTYSGQRRLATEHQEGADGMLTSHC